MFCFSCGHLLIFFAADAARALKKNEDVVPSLLKLLSPDGLLKFEIIH